MSEMKFDPKDEGQPAFDAETLGLKSQMPGANANPHNEHAKKRPAAPNRDPRPSTEMIYHLIDFIKSM
jgi:hypothetical protein